MTTRTRRAPRRLPSLLSQAAPRPVELLVVAVALLLLTAAVYGPHALDGGFLSDDWALQEDVSQAGDFFAAFDDLEDGGNMSNRPLMAAYMALTHTVFGAHMGFHLALAAGLAALMAFTVYLLLRLLRFERLHAGLVAALVLLFPAADAPRLWAGAAAGQLTVALFLFGVSIAVLAFRAEGRRAVLLHGTSLLLYLASILLHESTLLGIGAAVIVYLLVATWRSAAIRWVADLVCTSLVVLLVTLSSDAWPRQGFDGQVEHAKQIFDEGWTLLGSVVLPLGDVPRSLVLALLVALPLVALFVAHRRSGAPHPPEIVRWAAAVAGGFLIVVLGYLIYVPAISYYTPAAAGIANRMNTLASVGFVLIAYGSLVLLGALAARTVRSRATVVAVVGVVGSAVLAIGYLDQVADDSRRFERAFVLGDEVLWALQQAVPDPPRGSTIFSAGQPIEIEPGFPVFGNTWDLTGAVRVKWNDSTLTGLPLFPGTTMACQADGFEPQNARYTNPVGPSESFRTPYGKVIFFHFPSRRAELPRSRAQCEAALEWFQPGPEYAPPDV